MSIQQKLKYELRAIILATFSLLNQPRVCGRLERQPWLWLERRYVVSRNFGFKIAYIGIRTREDTGSDNDTFTIGCSLLW